VDIIWRGPLREDDRASQVSEVEGFVTRGVSGIVLRRWMKPHWWRLWLKLRENKIPVVIIDSGLKSNDYVSFVATDNRQGGRMAGDGLAALLPNGGKVVICAMPKDRRARMSARKDSWRRFARTRASKC